MPLREPENLPYPEQYAVVVKGGKDIRSTPTADDDSNVRRQTLPFEQIPILGTVKMKDGDWVRGPDGWLHLKTAVETVVPYEDISGFDAGFSPTELKKWMEGIAPLTEGLIKVDVPSDVKLGVNVTGSPTLNIQTNISAFMKKNWPWVAAGSIVLISVIGSVIAVTRSRKKAV